MTQENKLTPLEAELLEALEYGLPILTALRGIDPALAQAITQFYAIGAAAIAKARGQS